MTLGLIDNHITRARQQAIDARQGSASHGDLSLELMQLAHDEVAPEHLHYEQVGLVSIPDQKDILYHLLKGVDELIAQGVRVICMPVGFSKPSPILVELAKVCIEKDILLIAPAGNKGADRIMYPAACSGVLGVGAVDATGILASYSGSLQDRYGECIKPEILAEGIYTTNYEELVKGTSVACAKVAGLAGALLEVRPELTALQLKGLLCASTIASEGSRYGRIDARKAMHLVKSGDIVPSVMQEPTPQHFKPHWIDPQLRAHCKRAARQGRCVQALIAGICPSDLMKILDDEVLTISGFTHFKVTHIQVFAASIEKLLDHPDLAWVSAIDVNYFDF